MAQRYTRSVAIWPIQRLIANFDNPMRPKTIWRLKYGQIYV